MSKSTYIPNSDLEFLSWTDNFINKVTPDYGVSEADLSLLKKATVDFHSKITHLKDVAALAKQATAEKNGSRHYAENLFRSEVRRIKARADYTEGQGANLGIEGSENTFDLNTSNPDLSGADRAGPNCLNRHYQFISEYLSLY